MRVYASRVGVTAVSRRHRSHTGGPRQGPPGPSSRRPVPQGAQEGPHRRSEGPQKTTRRRAPDAGGGFVPYSRSYKPPKWDALPPDKRYLLVAIVPACSMAAGVPEVSRPGLSRLTRGTLALGPGSHQAVTLTVIYYGHWLRPHARNHITWTEPRPRHAALQVLAV